MIIQAFFPISIYFIFALIVWKLRYTVRSQRGIHGSMAEDCCLSCFCYPCIAFQMAFQIWKDPSIDPGKFGVNNENIYIHICISTSSTHMDIGNLISILYIFIYNSLLCYYVNAYIIQQLYLAHVAFLGGLLAEIRRVDPSPENAREASSQNFGGTLNRSLLQGAHNV